MDDYDAFEPEMLEAGWTLDKIEAAWQSALEDMRNVSDYGIVYRDTDSFYVPDT